MSTWRKKNKDNTFSFTNHNRKENENEIYKLRDLYTNITEIQSKQNIPPES